ncbi:NrfD/PsrC family molybdoenzyme membrane anchor subunit [Sandaracinus amylolyticus]|uniref:NrfD/PsrC family molybdoenzyme membrane anchor subunit n=1 Tax=Sandaracinus amylolyticus TaxID=927083 RepID=UPI001F1AFB9F|nr:NrfD/PsrC family molybdoenzyme membrane anchor subunit [Sandaracinus amylolyticus]UJR80931.1 Alternative complex III molybdopterin oxidoreductase membrane subunit ActC [Sandaracinus amylolyticus]
MAGSKPIKELGEGYLATPGTSFHDVTEIVSRVTETKAPRGWWILFGIAVSITGVLGATLAYLLWTGIGVWGNNSPVAWAWDITNFVWWIGIGHAGTLISAVLFLFRQYWRTAINRFSEAMTIFAVICALMFPTIHTGRPWHIYYPLPIPNGMNVWPNFKSPLLWDVFAVSTYFTVSLLFWYVGLIPDFATLRDRTKNKVRQLAYGFLALGWRGSNRHWSNYERAYLILAAISTPLVLSVHSVVSFDFATSVEPGWHTTIFPPYFVAGAVFSGFAMVMTLLLIARTVFKLHDLVQMRHLEMMNKIILTTGSLVGYAYAMEFFIAWYSGNPYERYVFLNRAFGDYWWAYWSMITCNVLVPQTYWFRSLRTNLPWMFVASILVNIGMWFERFVIIVTTLHRDYLPSSWGNFSPTLVDWTTYLGSIGLFFTLFLLFIRWIPMIAIAEVKMVLPQADPHAEDHDHDEHEHAPAVRGPAVMKTGEA